MSQDDAQPVEGSTSNAMSRRTLLKVGIGAGGLAAVGGVAAWAWTGRPDTFTPSRGVVGPGSRAVQQVEAGRRRAGQRVVTATLEPRPITADLGGLVVDTWAYGDSIPGPLIRARAGDLVRVTVKNGLPASTSVHWHGIALRNDMDGVPGITQDPIAVDGSLTYEFTAPDPGTYFYHPHSGTQLDRGLYGPLIIDDPSDPGDYDVEWLVVVDDWLDGTGRTPNQVLKTLTSGGMGGMDMSGMDMGGMGHRGMRSAILGSAGDVRYPWYLINGQAADVATPFRAEPGMVARFRFINAASDTAFRVALGGHRMTITHSDGYPVLPHETDAILIGMGERYDVRVVLNDGAFPLVASAEGKGGYARTTVTTSPGLGSPRSLPAELDGEITLGTDLTTASAVQLPKRTVDREHQLLLRGSMMPYRWTINGQTYPNADPLDVKQGERLRLVMRNMSTMFHPMHVHGHTFAIGAQGPRKDTVIVRPMQQIAVDIDADNPGQWATHCHNVYHAETGMMTTLSYVT